MTPREATIQAMDEVTGPVIGITLVLMAVFLPTRVPRRHHRPALPPVRADHRGHGADQRDQRADAEAGAVRRLAAPRRRQAQRVLPRASTAATAASSAATRASSRGWCARPRLDDARLRRSWSRSRLWWFHVAADRLPADRGPGLRHRRRAAARRRVAAAHARGRRADERDHRRHAGRRRLVQRRRLLAPRRHDRARTRRRSTSSSKPWDERTDAEPEPGGDPRRRCAGGFAEIAGGRSSFAFPPPSIRGLGVAGGFQMQIEDRGGVGLRGAAADASRRCCTTATRRAGSPRSTRRFRAGVPQLFADIDRVKVEVAGRAAERRLRHAAGVPRLGLRQRLQHVRPHVPGARAGRAAVPRRRRTTSRGLEVRNASGEMVPLGTLLDVRDAHRPADHPALQPLPDGGDHRRGGARRTARARRSS